MILKITFFDLIIYLFGIAAAIHVLHTSRTAQGTIAWGFALITCPYIAFPLYIIFGGRKYIGFAHVKQKRNRAADYDRALKELKIFKAELPPAYSENQKAFEELSGLPFVTGNKLSLLINGDEFFAALFEAIEQAQKYVLLEYYILRFDTIGQKLKDLLIKKSQQGVRVYLIYDSVGSFGISSAHVKQLIKEGVFVAPFTSKSAIITKMSWNFRNHRKMTVVDGNVGIIGGFNIGDEYKGSHRFFGPWRDTAVLIDGPAVKEIQLSFLRDWSVVNSTHIDLEWKVENSEKNEEASLVTVSGPADELSDGALYIVEKINSAAERIWITSPYFVPDSSVMNALVLASLGGVDVRIILPKYSDNLFVQLSSYFYIQELSYSGIKLYRYQAGFLHQKVMLIDQTLTAIGSANFDNRSFRINFEIDILSHDLEFARKLEASFLKDFSVCKEIAKDEYEKCSFLFRTCVQIARLLSPVL
jgi:cardiolipin synthase